MWIRLAHFVGLTNLTDADVDTYILSAKKPNRRLSLAGRDLPLVVRPLLFNTLSVAAILSVVLALLVAVQMFPMNGVLSELLRSVRSALLVTLIALPVVCFLGARFLVRDIEHRLQSLSDMTEVACQLSRSSDKWFVDTEIGMHQVLDAFSKEDRTITIVGRSLRSVVGQSDRYTPLQQEFRAGLVSALRRGTHVKVLLASPEIAHHFNAEESRAAGSSEAEIIESLLSLTRLAESIPEGVANLDVKLYRGIPPVFMVSTSSLVAVSLYHYGLSGTRTLITARHDSDVYRQFLDFRDRVWTNSSAVRLDIAGPKSSEALKRLVRSLNECGDKLIPPEILATQLEAEMAELSRGVGQENAPDEEQARD